jgi:DNA-binding response OmpR family regulator
MKEQAHILVVDDDFEIRELLGEYLAKVGYRVSVAEDGEAMQRHLDKEGFPSLILLDVMMPGDDGFTLCQKLRRQSNVPIIMLTAVSDDTNQIIGLEIGADDYIAKPYNPRQLVARIKAVLRRFHVEEQTETSVPKSDAIPKAINFGAWQLDTLAHRLINRETNQQLDLTGNDFALLMLFLSRPNEVIDRDTISCETRGRGVLPFERGIDVQLSRLRQRLGDNGKYPQYIKTKRGGGYIFTAQVSYEH